MALWSRNWFIGTILFVMGLANPTLIEVVSSDIGVA